MWLDTYMEATRDLTIKSTGHKVWCTNGRRPEGYRKPADKCRECGKR
jgi:uncharacterized protein (DUF983 family)